MDEYLGVIKIFAGTFAPRGYMFCAGQIMSIAQNSALFSLLGTTYGGNGSTTFALPDLRGRTPIGGGMGTGPGLSNYVFGQVGGTESVTLTTAQIPAHTHNLNVNNTNANNHTPTNSSTIAASVDINGDNGMGFSSEAPNTVLNPASITGGGSSQPHDNRSPYLGIGYIICVNGIYPSRN